jgi:hypothetical protein
VFLLYLGWSLLRWNILSPDDTVPFWTFVAVVPVHFLLTGLIGVTAGAFIHNYVETGRSLDETDNWEFTLSRYGDDEVVVRTCGGKEVQGEVVDTAVFDQEEGIEASRSDGDGLNTTGLDTSEGILLTDPSVTDREAKEKVKNMYDEEEGEEESSQKEVRTDGSSDHTAPLHLTDEDTNYAYFARDDVEAILFLDKLTEEKGPRVSRDDRAQEFLGSVIDELAPQSFTPNISEQVQKFLCRVALLIILVGSVVLLANVSRAVWRTPLGINQTIISIGGLLTTSSTVLLINGFDSPRWKKWLTFTLLIFFWLVPVALSYLLFSPLDGLSLLSGALLGLILSSAFSHTARQYGWRPAAYTTLAVLSFASLSHTLQFGVWSQAAEQFSAIGIVVWTTALLLNRLRVGDGSGFDNNAGVAADGVVWLLIALAAAGVAIPSRIPYAVSTIVYAAGSLLVGVTLASFLTWRIAEE